jgi:hypothetical protein
VDLYIRSPIRLHGGMHRENFTFSGRTMALGSTQSLTEMSTRNLSGGKRWTARKADSLTAICEPVAYKMWEPRQLTTLWASTVCYRHNVTL